MKEDLREKIAKQISWLEVKRKEELQELKTEFHILHENLKPINQVKHFIGSLTGSPDVKQGIAKAAIGTASGYLARKVLFRPTINPLKKLLGFAVQTAVTKLAAHNSEKIQSSGKDIFQHLISLIGKKKRKKEFLESEMYE
jgi:hypothetical protein